MKYSENNGLVCHPHDVKWINEELEKVRPNYHGTLVRKYSEAYTLALQEHHGIKAEGMARRLTNTRLREAVESILATSGGKVFSPPQM